MKTGSGSLLTHLTTGQEFRRAELWTFTLLNGTVLRYTTLDVDVPIGGHTWLCNGPVLKRPRARMVAGVEVDEFEINVFPADTDTIAGLTWQTAARQGLLRGGEVLIERLYMPTWGDVSLGKLYTMGGGMTDVRGGSELSITVKSPLERFNTQIPRDLVQTMCIHTLFDSACGLNKASFAATSSVTAGSTAANILCGLSQADAWFSLGRIVFTSGVNNGQSRSVKRYTVGSIALAVPLFAPCANGDTFTIYPGCDRSKATCESAKFNNVVNFGGMPFVPRAEVAI